MSVTKASVGDLSTSALAHATFVLSLVAIAIALPAEAYHSSRGVFIVFGIIGAWRYGWWLLNFARSLYYRKVDYPRLRQAAEQAQRMSSPGRVFFLVTTYKVDRKVTRKVYEAVFQCALVSGRRVDVIASIVEDEDAEIIRRVFEETVESEHIRIEIIKAAPTGKRDALVVGLRSIAEHQPNAQDILVVVDGDSVVPWDLIPRAAPFFSLGRHVGALTTDEICEAPTASFWYRRWFDLRFAQRQMLMCSLGLSRRVLTLTGRTSLFRANLATDPTFIRQIQLDWIDHWRLGTFTFVTGDDKSSWYWLLKNGYHMLYLPDVTVTAYESQPSGSFVGSSVSLMRRWFGNMLRTNGRALQISPRKIGWFTWWSILDQRVSMWTGLTGSTFALLATALKSVWVAPIYLLWVLASRYLITLSLLSVRSRASVVDPFLLYYNQIVGSVVKLFVLAHLDKQKWTRQSSGLQNVAGEGVLKAGVSNYIFVLSLLVLTTGVALFSGMLEAEVLLNMR